MHIEKIDLEITRRCTLECEHCLRGEIQDINIGDETLKNIFENIKTIDTLLITGGEPLIAVNELEKIVQLIGLNKIKIGQIRLITNGTILSSRVLKILKELSKISNLDLKISFDIFHKIELEKRNLKDKRDNNVKVLKEIFGAKEYGEEDKYQRENIKYEYQGLQPIGRAKNLNFERLKEINSLVFIKYTVFPFVTWFRDCAYFEGDKLCGTISIDVNGNIVERGLSFEEEDRFSKQFETNINELSFVDAINNYINVEQSKSVDGMARKK